LTDPNQTPTRENAADNTEETPPIAEASNTAPPPPPGPPPQAEADNALANAKAEAQKYLDAWQRERAEFANYKKRVAQERADALENAAVDVMKSLLPVIDDFERAVANTPEDIAETPWAEGVVAIERKLKRLLEKYEIEAVDPVGEPFDPDSHQALGIDEAATVESGHVSETLQKGYRTENKMLRPALVRVAG
jgi:molecular chaperone GrpE